VKLEDWFDEHREEYLDDIAIFEDAMKNKFVIGTCSDCKYWDKENKLHDGRPMPTCNLVVRNGVSWLHDDGCNLWKEMNKQELTGEQLTELFFTKVKGWERISTPFYKMPTGGYHNLELPQLHKSLDLQEEWLWPELRKVEIDYIAFDDMDTCWACEIDSVRNYDKHGISDEGKRFETKAETKALAQLKAGLKALEVL
jgi:hypothetical protein